MPYRKPYRKRRRNGGRRMYKKRGWTSRNPVPRKTLLGNSKAVRLRYVTGLELSPSGIGLPSVHVFSANGLFDPDITGVGHQPRGFDQIQALYAHHTIIYSKCTAWFTPANTIGGVVDGKTQMVAVSLKAGLTPFTTSAFYLEGRNVNYKCLGSFNQSAPVSCNMKYTPKNFLATPSPLSSNELKGSATANPLEGAFFHVCGLPITFGVDNGSIQISVTIEYIAVFHEPVEPAES